MQHQEIVLGQPGQSFRFDPPDGRPASSPTPTVEIIYVGHRLVAATTGECSIDPVDTVLHGDANRGGTTLRVASIDGIAVGGRYLMTKPEGDHEWIEVTGIRDTTLLLRHPLLHRYAGAATIRGCRISIAIDPDWSGNRGNLTDVGNHHGLAGYMLRWSYTVNDVEVTGVSFADLVTLPSSDLVTPNDIDARVPGWLANLPAEHRPNGGADFIAEAFRAVRLEAIGDAHAQRRIRDTRVIRELVHARAQVIRLEHEVIHGERRTPELAVAEGRYRRRYAQLVRPSPLETVEPVKQAPPPRAKLAKGSQPGIPRRIPKLTRH